MFCAISVKTVTLLQPRSRNVLERVPRYNRAVLLVECRAQTPEVQHCTVALRLLLLHPVMAA